MKDKKNLLKGLILGAGVLVIIAIAFILSLNTKKEKNLEEIKFEGVNELLESKNLSIVSLVDTSYEEGTSQLNTFKELTDKYYMNVKYVDYKNAIVEYGRFIEENNIDTKTGVLSLVLYNGEVVDTIDGNKTSDELIESLSKYIDFIYRDFMEISGEEYLKLLDENEEIKLVYVAKPTCSYCKLMTPILKEVKNENKLSIYYLNSGAFTEADYMAFIGTDDSLLQGFGTPMLIITKDGAFIDVLEGYVPKEELVKFLKENGIIE